MDGRTSGEVAQADFSEPKPEMEALNIKLPVPAFMGTPTDISLTAQPHGDAQPAKADNSVGLFVAGQAPERRSAQLPPAPNKPAISAGRLAENAGLVGDRISGGAGAAPGAEAVPAVPPQAAAVPMAAGVRPIRIEIPRDGIAFSFTKVLNGGEEPLTISAKLMSAATFVRWRAFAQAAVFLAGCLILFRQWISGKWNSLVVLAALLLVGGSVSHFLLNYRLLDLALILIAPVLLFVAIGWFLWICWPKKQAVPPVVAACLLLFAANARGQMGSVQPDARDATNGVVALSTALEGHVQDATASIEAVIRMNFSKTNQVFQLFGNDIAIQQFQAEPAQARLWRQGRFVSVYYPGMGEVTVKLKGVAPTWRRCRPAPA